MSNMKSTLTEIKDILVAEKTAGNLSLSHINTFKRGVLPPMPAFPAIAILPERERIIRRQSNGRQLVERDVRIEVYSKNAKRRDAVYEIQNTMNAIKEIGQAQLENKWNDCCFDFDMDIEAYENPEFITRNVVIQGGTMLFRFRDAITIPVSSRVSATVINETDSKSMVEAIHSKLLEYKTNATYSLEDVAVIEVQDIPSIPKFPAITVIEVDLRRDKTYTSMDSITRSFDISVWTQLTDKEGSLNKNLDITEIMRNILEIENLWVDSTSGEGRAYNSLITNIEYNREDVRSIGKVYRTAISYDILSFEPHFFELIDGGNTMLTIKCDLNHVTPGLKSTDSVGILKGNQELWRKLKSGNPIEVDQDTIDKLGGAISEGRIVIVEEEIEIEEPKKKKEKITIDETF